MDHVITPCTGDMTGWQCTCSRVWVNEHGAVQHIRRLQALKSGRRIEATRKSWKGPGYWEMVCDDGEIYYQSSYVPVRPTCGCCGLHDATNEGLWCDHCIVHVSDTGAPWERTPQYCFMRAM